MRVPGLLAPVALLAATLAWTQESRSNTASTWVEGDPAPAGVQGALPVADVDPAQAFWNGKRLYDAGEFALAVRQFQLAYAVTHDPTLLYNIAQSYRKSGECLLAVENYQAFLRLAPESPLMGQAEKQVSALQESCKTPELASRVPPIQPRPQPSPSGGVAQPKPAPTPPTHLDERGSSSLLPATRVWSVIALSGAVIAGGVAVGLELWNHQRYDDWKASDQNLAQGVARGENEQHWVDRVRANDDLARSIERVDHETIGVSIGAGALLATAVTLYVWPRDRQDTQPHGKLPQPAMPPRAILHPRGLAIVGSF